MFHQDFVLAYVTIPMIATGLLIWAKLRRLIMLLEEVRDCCKQTRV